MAVDLKLDGDILSDDTFDLDAVVADVAAPADAGDAAGAGAVVGAADADVAALADGRAAGAADVGAAMAGGDDGGEGN